MFLWRVLTDPERGMFTDRNVRVLQERTQREVMESVELFFKQATTQDTLLLYFSGHGMMAGETLYLCVRDTKSTSVRSTGLATPEISKMIEESHAEAVIILLDCCYSGAFKGGDFTGSLGGDGRYVIAATTPYTLASDATDPNSPSPFTEVLLESLLQTPAEPSGFVDMDGLYLDLEARIPTGGPRPKRGFDGSGRVAIAKRRDADPDMEDSASTPGAQPHTTEGGQTRTVSSALLSKSRTRGDLVRADLETWKVSIGIGLALMAASITAGLRWTTDHQYNYSYVSADELFYGQLIAIATSVSGLIIVALATVEGFQCRKRRLKSMGRRSVMEELPRLTPRLLRPLRWLMVAVLFAELVVTVFAVDVYYWQWTLCISLFSLQGGLMLARQLGWGDDTILISSLAILVVAIIPIDSGNGFQNGLQGPLGLIWAICGGALLFSWYWWSPRPIIGVLIVVLVLSLLSSILNAGQPQWIVTFLATAIATFSLVRGAGQPLPLKSRDS